MKKFAAIDGLRGWMAWWVVLGHVAEVTGLGGIVPLLVTKALSLSYMAVQVFMIVSGFVIAHVLLSNRESYGTYLGHRWFRLMPLMLLLLVVAIGTRDLYAIAWIDNPWAHGVARIDRMRAEEAHWLVHGALHLLLLHGMVPESVLPYASTTLLAPAWSLSLEWQFYLVAPLIASALVSFRHFWFAALLMALSIPTLLGTFGVWTTSQPFLLQNLPFFFVGIASRHAFEGRIPAPALLSCALSIVIFVAARGINQFLLLLPVAGLWTLYVWLSFREARPAGGSRTSLDRLAWVIAYNPFAAEAGRLSYATYLCHVPVLTIVIATGMRMTGRDDQPLIVVLALVALPITVALSVLLNRLVEQPGIHLGKRLLSSRPAARAAS